MRFVSGFTAIIFVAVIFAFGSCFFRVPASAQVMVIPVCWEEINQFCDRHKGNESEVLTCLLNTDREFSPSCRGFVEKQRSRIERQSRKNLRKACRSDIHKYCSEFKGNKGKILQCLEEKKDDLRPICKIKLEHKLNKITQLHQACQSDINTHCESIDSTQHKRIRACLKNHSSTLSVACQTYVNQNSLPIEKSEEETTKEKPAEVKPSK